MFKRIGELAKEENVVINKRGIRMEKCDFYNCKCEGRNEMRINNKTAYLCDFHATRIVNTIEKLNSGDPEMVLEFGILVALKGLEERAKHGRS